MCDLDKTSVDVREDAYPLKRFMRMVPFTKSLVTWVALIDEDWSKEMYVTIQETNR